MHLYLYRSGVYSLHMGGHNQQCGEGSSGTGRKVASPPAPLASTSVPVSASVPTTTQPHATDAQPGAAL